MKAYKEILSFEFSSRVYFKNITPHVKLILEESGITEGLVLVSSYHTSAGVYINDEEEGLLLDIERWLEKLAPYAPMGSRYSHNSYEDNADAHLKSLLIGRTVTVAVTNGQLELGNWEQIYYADFDGKRKRKILVKVYGE